MKTKYQMVLFSSVYITYKVNTIQEMVFILSMDALIIFYRMALNL